MSDDGQDRVDLVVHRVTSAWRRMPQALRHMFRALRRRNYRIFFIGYLVSMSGTWMAGVAQGWLVFRLSGHDLDVGVLTALQLGPSLVLSPWGGVVADRRDKRHLLMVTNSASATIAFVLGMLTLAGAVQVWMVYALTGLFGCVFAIDNPTRQAFVHEMVGRDHLTNAVGLNSLVTSISRIVGPTLAGALIAATDIAWSFIGNAASFLVMVVALALMRARELEPAPRQPRRPHQLRDGLMYVAGTHDLMVPLLMIAAVGVLSYNYSVLLPLLDEQVLGRGGGSYGALTTALGVGASVGAVVVAALHRPTRRLFLLTTLVFGASSVAVGLSPGLTAALVLLVLMGAAADAFASLSNSLMQLEAEPAMRGRVMALWGAVLTGGALPGGPLAAELATWLGTRAAFAIGGAAAVLTAVVAAVYLRRRSARGAAPPPPAPVG